MHDTMESAIPPGETKGNSRTVYNFKALARACVRKFLKYDHQVSFTDYVIFNQPQFQQWLDYMKGAATIRAEFGVYTQEFIDAINDMKGKLDEFNIPYPFIPQQHVGRLTVFFFAYNEDNTAFYTQQGKESSAYNLGNLHP